jgi:hypothetical protein
MEQKAKFQHLILSAEIIFAHHKRSDGGGYPTGQETAEILAGARIFAVADPFDAKTSDRPYRRALRFESSREGIERGAGKEYDSQVAKVFLSISGETWRVIRRETAAIESLCVSNGERHPGTGKLAKFAADRRNNLVGLTAPLRWSSCRRATAIARPKDLFFR